MKKSGNVKESTIKAFDGTVLFRPDGRGHYNALWTRDFCCMLEGLSKYIPHEDAVNAYYFIIERQREDGAIPDGLEPEGTPCYHVFGQKPLPITPNSQLR